jgi:hypothetical protein
MQVQIETDPKARDELVTERTTARMEHMMAFRSQPKDRHGHMRIAFEVGVKCGGFGRLGDEEGEQREREVIDRIIDGRSAWEEVIRNAFELGERAGAAGVGLGDYGLVMRLGGLG